MEAPEIEVYRFERESCDRMLAKCKTLVEYEPREQLYTSKPKPRGLSQDDSIGLASLSISDPSAETQVPHTVFHNFQEPGFYVANLDARQIACPLPKVPPDETPMMTFMNDMFIHPCEQLLDSVCHGRSSGSQAPVILQTKSLGMRQSLDRAKRDYKGVVAVIIASL